MPIVKTLEASTYKAETFIDADVIRVGEAFSRLFGFTQGDAPLDVFACDGGTFAALRRAAARIVKQPQDKATTIRYSRKPGTKAWKRTRKGQTVPSNHETREATVRGWSGDAVRAAIETLRETHGIAIRRDAERKTIDGDEYLVVALVRRDTADTADTADTK